MDKISSLFVAIVEWAGNNGASDLGNKPGVWKGRTVEAAGLGPLDVRLNAHGETVEGIPPMSAAVTRDAYFPGIIGIFDPLGGTYIRSPEPGEDETGLLAHFKGQPVPEAVA